LRILLFGIATFLTAAQAKEPPPPQLIADEQFIEIAPFEDRDQLACANNSDYSWETDYLNGSLRIKSKEHSRSPLPDDLKVRLSQFRETALEQYRKQFVDGWVSAYMRLTNGWLVGFDAGEFGGGLWWIDDAGPGLFLSQQNVHKLFRYGDKILAAVGLAHLSFDDGAIIVFEESLVGAPSVVKKIRSPSSVEDAKVIGDDIIGATFIGPIIVNNAGVVKYDGTGSGRNRHLTYPNSVSIDDYGTVYIGSRYAVLVYKNLPSDFTPTWLVPQVCAKFIPDQYKADCKCVSG
jgi:hypothetical protein